MERVHPRIPNFWDARMQIGARGFGSARVARV
jgi:hypothetical protein